MKIIFILLFMPIMMNAQTIVDFKNNPITKNWTVVDDVVMGGRSSGKFTVKEEHFGEFSGEVSLENNGGFSSVRYDMDSLQIKPKDIIRLRLKGDGNNYQFRVKASKQEYYSYNKSFETTGDWQTIDLPLQEFFPSFRGRRLDLPNFDKNSIEEIRFLIGNKKPQEFQLLLESIQLISRE